MDGNVILLVLSRHADSLPILSRIGWIGVDLFFVLSGFLVSGLLFDEHLQTGSFRPGPFFASVHVKGHAVSGRGHELDSAILPLRAGAANTACEVIKVLPLSSRNTLSRAVASN